MLGWSTLSGNKKQDLYDLTSIPDDHRTDTGKHFTLYKHSLKAGTKDNTIAEHKQKLAATWLWKNFPSKTRLWNKGEEIPGPNGAGCKLEYEQLNETLYKKVRYICLIRSSEENSRGSKLNLSTEWQN